tara:strand:+ start:827 stop:1771 length:945 start_codon:yes stop_codon:yes gene_type:complete
MAPYRLKHRIEYWAMRGFGFLLAHTPYPVALFIGWQLAWFSHYVLRYRREVAYARIREVFPDADERRVKHIAWLGWRDFVFNAVEMFRLPRVDQKWIEKHVIDWEQTRDVIQRHCKSGQGAVVASPHIGAAELAAVCLQRFDTPIFLITGKQKNPLTDARLNEMRSSTGMSYVQVGSSMLKAVIRRLRDGGILAFQADLRVAKGGIEVDLLGTTASVAPGMAMFANQTNVPILPMLVTRHGWTRHKMEFQDPILPDPDSPKKEDQKRLTREMFVMVDKAVRDFPEQWFWYNKSWILAPVPDEQSEPAEAKQTNP